MSSSQLVQSVGSVHYFVVQSQSKMPSSVKSRYYHSAVVEVEGEPQPPKAIRNTRSATVLWDSGPGYAGKTSECAADRDYDRALDKARAYAHARVQALSEVIQQGYDERSGEEV